MLAYLSLYVAVIPTFMSILALVLFIDKTKYLSYTTIILSMMAEIIAPSINMAALVACTSCLGGVMFIHYLRISFNLRFNLVVK